MSIYDNDARGAAQNKSRRALTLTLAAVLLAIAAVASWMMLTGWRVDKTPKPPKPGAVLAMDPVTVNLADGHYLKMRIALQTTTDAGSDLNGSKAIDLAITKYTDMPIGELSSAAGRAKAKAELLEMIKEAYDGKIMDIYFTEFVMQ